MFRGDLRAYRRLRRSGRPKFGKVKWKSDWRSGYFLACGGRWHRLHRQPDGSLYPVDLESGAQKWKLALGVRSTSSAAVDSRTVYLGTYSGRFYAGGRGKRELKLEVPDRRRTAIAAKHLHGSEPAEKPCPTPLISISSPAVWNGGGVFRSGDGNVLRLDAVTGALNWKFSHW